MSPCTDQFSDLITRIAANDPVAMEELYAETSTRLLAFLLRLLRQSDQAEEVLQEVYRQIWTQAPRWSDIRGNGMSWIYTIARSRALDHLRSRSRRQRVEETLDFPLISLGDSPERACEKTRLAGKIADAFRVLPESQRTVIEMAFYEGYSHSEIAGETGLPIGTIKSRIRSGLIQMRGFLHPEMTRAAA